MHPPREPIPPHNVLSYSGPSPLSVVRELKYERAGDVLTIFIPPASLGWQLVGPILLLVVCGLPVAILIIVFVQSVRDRSITPFDWLCPAVVAALFIWGVVYAVQRIMYVSRNGRSAWIVRASPVALEIVGPGKTRGVQLSVVRAKIADISIHPGGVGLNPTLGLEVICSDDSMHVITLPWPRGAPMIELEDNVRDVLGLRGLEHR